LQSKLCKHENPDEVGIFFAFGRSPQDFPAENQKNSDEYPAEIHEKLRQETKKQNGEENRPYKHPDERDDRVA